MTHQTWLWSYSSPDSVLLHLNILILDASPFVRSLPITVKFNRSMQANDSVHISFQISRLGNLVFRTKDNNFQILAGSAGFLLPAYVVG